MCEGHKTRWEKFTAKKQSNDRPASCPSGQGRQLACRFPSAAEAQAWPSSTCRLPKPARCPGAETPSSSGRARLPSFSSRLVSSMAMSLAGALYRGTAHRHHSEGTSKTTRLAALYRGTAQRHHSEGTSKTTRLAALYRGTAHRHHSEGTSKTTRLAALYRGTAHRHHSKGTSKTTRLAALYRVATQTHHSKGTFKTTRLAALYRGTAQTHHSKGTCRATLFVALYTGTVQRHCSKGTSKRRARRIDIAAKGHPKQHVLQHFQEARNFRPGRDVIWT